MKKLDLDRFDRQVTLIITNCLYENFFEALFHWPQRLLCTVPSWFTGRAVAQFQAVNTQGTINVITATQKARVRRTVVMSSTSPIGCNLHPDHRFPEESPYHSYMGYGRSKMLMEKVLRAEIAAGSPMEIVIVRAPWFYGPNQPPRQMRFSKMIRDGTFPIVEAGRNRRSMVYTGNLPQRMLLAAVHQRALGEMFWLPDEILYTVDEIVETIGDVLRGDFGMAVKPNKLRLPSFVGGVATLVDATLQYAGIYHQNIHVLSEMNKTISCGIAKVRKVLGYKPKIALREGMRLSIERCLVHCGQFDRSLHEFGECRC